jgi:nucleoside 2-deoxyribosyltransferase
MESNVLRAYCASPLGFSEATRLYYNQVYLPRLSEAGVQPIDPWQLTSDAEIKAVLDLPLGTDRNTRLHALHHEIGKRNRLGIDRADVIIAILDGQEIDSGTVAEVGYGVGRGKVVFGLRSDFRQNGEEGAAVNLQVEYFIEHSGGRICSSLNELIVAVQDYRARYC